MQQGAIKIEVPGFSVNALSGPRGAEGGDEWWMGGTKPLEMSRYALTNRTVSKPIAVTILRYASAEQAKKAFEMSWSGRPAAPKDITVVHWDAAHRWMTDMFLLKGDYAVGLYDLPSDFSTTQTESLLDALASNIAKAETGGAANQGQPGGSETNRTLAAAGPGG